MNRRYRWLRPSPAMIVALIALFVAMGGAGYAAVKLKKNAVKTKNIKDGAVTSSKLGNGAVTSSKLANDARSASNYTEDTTDNPIVGALETIGSPIQITTVSTRRVIAMAAVHATTTGTGAYLVCHIKIDTTTGVDDTDFAAPNGTFSPVDASVSPLASAVVGAGTHTATLECEALGGLTPTATVKDDALAALSVSG
jgi:hypothetical protein